MEDFIKQFHETMKRMTSDEEFAKEVLVQGKGNPITLGPRVKTAADWVDDMVAGAKSRSKRWLENSLRPRKDPKKAALAAKGKYESNVRKALEEKRWDDGIEGYDEKAREEVIANVGTSGFERGIETHKPKAVAKINKLRPMVAALAKTIDDMPQDTDSEREARMIAAKDGMKEIGRLMKK